MQHLSPGKTALAVGVFFGGWHVLWSLLVALNWAQSLYDFITLGAHDPSAIDYRPVQSCRCGNACCRDVTAWLRDGPCLCRDLELVSSACQDVGVRSRFTTRMVFAIRAIKFSD
jgi:hypothetical protein